MKSSQLTLYSEVWIERLKAIKILEIRQGCPVALFLLNIFLKILTREIKQEKKRGIQIRNEDVKLSFTRYHFIFRKL
jgi:hypothetical protein